MISENRRAYNKAWYESNPEKVKDYRQANSEKITKRKKVWYKANCDKIKDQKRGYYRSHAEERQKYHKIWLDANPEYVKAYCEANREKKRAYDKAYLKVHSEKCREKSRKHRALKRTTQVEPINEKTIYLRDGGICQHCKKRVDKRIKWPDPMSATLDHIVPLSQNGTHTYANMQLTHLTCNLSKNVNVLPQGEQLRMF